MPDAFCILPHFIPIPTPFTDEEPEAKRTLFTMATELVVV